MDLTRMSQAALIERLLAPMPATGAACTGERVTAGAAWQADRVRDLLATARELLLREMERDLQGRPLMDSPGTLRNWLRLHCEGLEHEVFLVVYLDAQHRVLTLEQLFRGSLTQTSVYPREVVKAALAHNAAAVAFAHNHPSGSAEPSRADEVLTATLKSALALVDVRCIDHFIVGGDQLVSFAERGLI
ncbi:RadC family protein [Pseudorhodoferax sp. Leaf267]|uniref:JAB domain-containing protein n=1 Tax=Pseudorhodoferax sp. Leaf267 TaxID=1736316 RepID=UPI0006F2536F|nr:JAB domain-containing protein [Pseudorhodoferax sp. Leaf267]KQP23345.1 DNA repair protein RadC [Pseudorhodoferax sp. Leaf267]